MFLVVGVGYENYRLSTDFQATTSFEGIVLYRIYAPCFLLLCFPSKYVFSYFCFPWSVYLILICNLFYLLFQGGDASVNSVHLFPKNTEHIIVCNKTSSIYIMTLQGQVLNALLEQGNVTNLSIHFPFVCMLCIIYWLLGNFFWNFYSYEPSCHKMVSLGVIRWS